MANIVNNLRINNTEVKSIKIKLHGDSSWSSLKEFYYNGTLIWKNANPFVFTKKIANINLSDFGHDTIIFEGFGEQEFVGSYNVVENAEEEKTNLVQGQMIVAIEEK
jgi:sorbitol-specific phosphotransferase system component IIA